MKLFVVWEQEVATLQAENEREGSPLVVLCGNRRVARPHLSPSSSRTSGAMAA